MSKRYEQASADVTQHLEALRKKYYDYLNGVTIAALFVADEAGVPCLKHHGYSAAAVCQIVSPKERAAGMADVLIVIDVEAWKVYDGKRKAALIDHELYHIEPVLKDNAPTYDAQDRPKLKIRKHDYQFGWFDEIAKRHGAASLEVHQARQLTELSGQLYFDFPSAA